MTDIERMLRQLARVRVAEAAREFRPVHRQRIAEDVVVYLTTSNGVLSGHRPPRSCCHESPRLVQRSRSCILAYA
jgi:hypothetical protein